jgi:NADH pyrophosphatase NudC (nudix superfamily)
VNHCGQCGSALDDAIDESGTAHRGCASCGWRWYDPPVPIVLVLVTTADGNVVYCNKDRHPHWTVVSGFITKGEQAESAALREVKEETNLDAEIVHFAGTHVFELRPEQIVIAFHVEATAGTPRAGDDVDRIEIARPDPTRLFPGSTSHLLVSRYAEGTCCRRPVDETGS